MKKHCSGCPVLETSFFSALKGSAKELLACLFVYGRYSQRQVIFQEGNPATRVYALKSGLLKTYKTNAGGKSQLLELIRPGEVFGLEGLSCDEYSVTVEVVQPAEICFFENARFKGMLAENPALAHEIIRILSGCLVAYQNKLIGWGTRTTESRMAGFLLDLRPPGAGEAAGWIELPISRSELASFLGVRIETLSRLMRRLENERILHASGKRVKVLDAARLATLA